jgi:hypothetical protein
MQSRMSDIGMHKNSRTSSDSKYAGANECDLKNYMTALFVVTVRHSGIVKSAKFVEKQIETSVRQYLVLHPFPVGESAFRNNVWVEELHAYLGTRFDKVVASQSRHACEELLKL